MDETLAALIEAAREATCDTHNIPACVELGKALYAYDKARGAICPTCDGSGLDHRGGHGDDGDDECPGPCEGGSGLVEPKAMAQCELVELVARTIYLEEDGMGAEDSVERLTIMGPDDGARKTWERAPEWERDDYRDAAKAVLRVVKTTQ